MKNRFLIPCVLWGMVSKQWPFDFVMCQYFTMWPTVLCSVADITGDSSVHHHSSKITPFELAWDSGTAWPGFDFVLSRSDVKIGRPGREPLLIGLVVCSGVNYGAGHWGAWHKTPGCAPPRGYWLRLPLQTVLIQKEAGDFLVFQASGSHGELLEKKNTNKKNFSLNTFKVIFLIIHIQLFI